MQRRERTIGWSLLLGVLLILATPARAGTWTWKAFEETEAEIARLSQLLGQKHQEVIARHQGHAPREAFAELDPIREKMKAARALQAQRLCWDRPKVERPRELFEKMRLKRVDRFRLDQDHLLAFVDQMVRKKKLTSKQARRLRFTLGRAGHGVMNPSSRGASQIQQRIAQALTCYGLADQKARPPRPKARPRPKPTVEKQKKGALRWYRSCGDHVCRDDGYRGPFPDAPACKGHRAGDACKKEGQRCDPKSNCNQLLICARSDPSTRCAR